MDTTPLKSQCYVSYEEEEEEEEEELRGKWDWERRAELTQHLGHRAC